MGEEVIAWLNQRQQLPESGIVAGQSVLTALLELYGDGKRRAPLNDIDVFLEVSPEVAKQLVESQAQRSDQSDMMGHASTRGSASNPSRTMNILEATDDRLVSIIRIQPELDPLRPNSAVHPKGAGDPEWRLYPGGITPDDLIRTFDINATCAAVDLKEHTLTWLPSFETFLESGGVLRLQDRSTPHTTLARLLKKVHEMPWLRGDVEELAERCMAGCTASWIHRNRLEFPIAHADTMLKLDDKHHYLDHKHDWSSIMETRKGASKATDAPIGTRLARVKGWDLSRFRESVREEAAAVRQPEFWSGLARVDHEFSGSPAPDDVLMSTNVVCSRMEGLYAMQHPLHAAVASDDPGRLAEMLNAGADPNELDAYGRTPGHWAAAIGRHPHLETLIEAGLDTGIRNRAGHTLLDVADWTPEFSVIARAAVARGACHSILRDLELELVSSPGGPR